MQYRSESTLPSWLSWLFLAVFTLHFVAMLSFQFAQGFLPHPVKSALYNYTLPWFYQNYLMFAPDPVSEINTFVYRVKINGEWQPWKDPVFQHLQAHWSNRLGNGADMYRILNGVADALFNGAHFIGFMDDPTDDNWFDVPGFKVAERFVLLESEYANHPDLSAFQAGVITEHHSIDDHGQVVVTKLFQPYPVRDVLAD